MITNSILGCPDGQGEEMLPCPYKLTCVEEGNECMSAVLTLGLLKSFLTQFLSLAGHGGDGEQPPAATGSECMEGPQRK